MYNINLRNVILTAFAAVALPMSAWAIDNAQATSIFESAKLRFENQRQDLNIVDQIQKDLDSADALSDDIDLKYQIRVLSSRAFYWQGVNVAGDQENNPAKLPLFEKGFNKARDAYALSTDYADAYYFYAINLSRWGLAKGKLSALNRLTELKNHLNMAMQRPSYYTGEDGTTIDFWGPNRVYGRMYYSLPGIVGGDMGLSKQYLEKAVQEAPTNMLNLIYLAETLADSRATRARAKQILSDAITKYNADPAGFCPTRIPETALEVEEAKVLLKKL